MNRHRQILAVDLDATLADIQTVFIKIAKEKYGIQVRYDQISDWEFWFRTIGHAQTWQTFKEIWTDRMLEVLPTEADISSELYKAIGKGYEIAIITGTQKECLPNVHTWLEKEKIPYKSITALFSGQSKWQYPFSAIIDDNPILAKEACIYPERQFFLKNQPWNTDVKPCCVQRVNSFAEMLQDLV